MEELPLVTAAEYRGGFKIELTFFDGTKAVVDFEEWLHGPIFEPLRGEDEFRRFFIDAGTIAWPNGADIAPETLYERAKANSAA
ncbi:MAG TPA: DUF2442 domain-containing protein [Actinomycetota bacterium]